MQVFFHKKFRKMLQKLPAALRKQAETKLMLFRRDPFELSLNNHPLSGRYEGYRSINLTGDLRMIYKALDKNTAYFVTLGSHSKLYR